jgi:hypothetical protein
MFTAYKHFSLIGLFVGGLEKKFYNFVTRSSLLVKLMRFSDEKTDLLEKTSSKKQWVENHPSNICICPIDICFGAWWYYAEGIDMEVKYGCLQMLDWLVSTHPEKTSI